MALEMAMNRMQNNEISVFTKNDLSYALKKRYGKITITGEMAEKALSHLNMDRKVGTDVSGAAIVGGIAASFLGVAIIGVPVLLAGMVGGCFVTSNEFKHYRAIETNDLNTIIVVRRGSIFDQLDGAREK